MKQISRLLVILTLCMSLSGCIYYKITHLSDEDLAWFDAYEEGDSLLFESNCGGKDTMVIHDIRIRNSLNPFKIGTGPSNYMQAYGNIDYYFAGKSRVDGHFSITKSVKSDSVCVAAGLNRRTTGSKREIFLHSSINALEIEGNNPENSIIFNNYNTSVHKDWQPTDEYDIKEFAWNKKLGLLYYEYDNGERYVFKGKINK